MTGAPSGAPSGSPSGGDQPPPRPARKTGTPPVVEEVWRGGGEALRTTGFLNKRGCLLISILFVFLLWVILGALVWLDDPEKAVYAPSAEAGDAGATSVGAGFVVTLPPGWTVESAGRRFAGPGGATLTIQRGRLGSLGMQPKNLSGKPIRGRYTAMAYGQGLLERIPDAEGVRWSRYLALGEMEGVEACLGAPAGVYRCVAFVLSHGVVQELRFLLPEGEGSAQWEGAERIFSSFRRVARERRRPERRSTPATNRGDGGDTS